MFHVFKSLVHHYFLKHRGKLWKVLLPLRLLIHWSNAPNLLSTGPCDGGAVLKCIGQILAWCHVSVTRWLEFEMVGFRLPELIGRSMRRSAKMSLHLAQRPPLETPHWSPLSSSSAASEDLCADWAGTGQPVTSFTPPPLYCQVDKVASTDMWSVLDWLLGWHIHWQARYYSLAALPQIVFQVLGRSRVILEAFMSFVRVSWSACHQRRGGSPAQRGHGEPGRGLSCMSGTWSQTMSHQTGINGELG